MEAETKSSQSLVSSSSHFRPDVHLPLEELLQPKEIRVDVFTTSNSKELYLSEIVWMVIKLTTSNATSVEVHLNALMFLNNLSKHRFENLENLELSGFQVNNLLRMILEKLCPKGLHLTCSLYPDLEYFFKSFTKIEKLHLNLEENSNLMYLPFLPSSLKELSLHFSNLSNKTCHALIRGDCHNLKKM